MADDRNRYRPPQPIKLTVDVEMLELKDNHWEFLIVAVVTQGNRALPGQAVCFFVDGVECPERSQTDENGRAFIGVDGIISKDAKRFSVAAQIVGQAPPARKIITLSPEKAPEVKEPTGPANLVVDPRRLGNEINLFILVVDEKKKGVPNARLTIIDGHNIDRVSADEFGEYLKTITLQPNQEREIAVYVAGFGDCGFRRTFKGRGTT